MQNYLPHPCFVCYFPGLRDQHTVPVSLRMVGHAAPIPFSNRQFATVPKMALIFLCGILSVSNKLPWKPDSYPFFFIIHPFARHTDIACGYYSKWCDVNAYA
jgi:hypothetical protein